MEAKRNDGGAAFPTPAGHAQKLEHENGEPYYRTVEICDTGMSLRDWFAGMALQGELASTAGVESSQATGEAAAKRGVDPAIHVALTCYEMADAMLKARTK